MTDQKKLQVDIENLTAEPRYGGQPEEHLLVTIDLNQNVHRQQAQLFLVGIALAEELLLPSMVLWELFFGFKLFSEPELNFVGRVSVVCEGLEPNVQITSDTCSKWFPEIASRFQTGPHPRRQIKMFTVLGRASCVVPNCHIVRALFQCSSCSSPISVFSRLGLRNKSLPNDACKCKKSELQIM
jgi:hypothetical protein